MFYILNKRKLIPIDPDRIYTFCPWCGTLHAVDLQSIIEAKGEDFDLLKTIDYCTECSQVRKEEA